MLKKMDICLFTVLCFWENLVKKEKKKKNKKTSCWTFVGFLSGLFGFFFFSPPNLFCFGEIIFTFKKIKNKIKLTCNAQYSVLLLTLFASYVAGHKNGHLK